MGKKHLSRNVRVSAPAKEQVLGTPSLLTPYQETRHIPKAQAKARKRAQERFTILAGGLDAQSRHVLAELRGDPLDDVDTTEAMIDTMMALDPNIGADAQAAEQELDLGGDDAVAYALRDLLDPRLRRRQVKDVCTWKHWLHVLDTRWQAMMPCLTDVYLNWKSRLSQPIPLVEPSELDFEIDILDLESVRVGRLIWRRNLPAAEALLLEGYLAATPEQPTIVVSLATLELF